MKHSKFYMIVILLLSSLGVSAQDEVITDTTKMSFSPLFLPLNYYRVNYTYTSVAPDGNTPVTLSAAMVFPKDVFERKNSIAIGTENYDACGLLLSNHYTMTTDKEAPTNNDEMQIEGPLSTMGLNFIIVSPDGYGLGATADKAQAYLMADATARHSIDAVKAARRLLSKMNYTYGDLFVQVGYSQGGHSAMAVQRYVDTHGAEPDAISHIDYTLCGDGPYDPSAMVDTLLLPHAHYLYPCAVPLIIQGQVEGAGLDISYSDCFREPFDTKAIEWLNAKTYTTDDINDSIYAITGGDEDTGILISDILQTENFAHGDSKMQLLFQALKDNSLVSDWQPNNATLFYLYHSKDDEIVPYFCMEHLVDFLKNDGGVGDDRLQVYKASGSHTNAAALFVINAMGKIMNMQSDYIKGDYTPTVIDSPSVTYSSSNKNEWYNLQGQRLPGRPQTAGLYIHKGKKVIVSNRR